MWAASFWAAEADPGNALLADILDVLSGASPAATDLPVPSRGEEISAGELRLLAVAR
jgi:hypothetical protein